MGKGVSIPRQGCINSVSGPQPVLKSVLMSKEVLVCAPKWYKFEWIFVEHLGNLYYFLLSTYKENKFQFLSLY